MLPPSLRPDGPKKELRVIGHYDETFVPIGCGPTHPNVEVFLKQKQADNSFKVSYTWFLITL